MKVKLRLMFLLGGLLIIPPILNFASSPRSNSSVDEISNSTYKRGHKHKAHTNIKYKASNQRSPLSSYGYVEDNTLHIYFSSPLKDVSLDITNVDIDTLVFSGKFTGTSLVIPLQDDGNEFNIDVN